MKAIAGPDLRKQALERSRQHLAHIKHHPTRIIGGQVMLECEQRVISRLQSLQFDVDGGEKWR